MKIQLFITFALFYSLNVRAQESNDEYKAMVDSSINLKTRYYNDINKKINIKDYIQNLYLLNEQNQPLNYIKSSSKFKMISIHEDRNKKLLTKGINAWKVLTLLNKNRFTVTILDLNITYKKPNYYLGNGGGSKAIFEYDCGKNTWELINSQNTGN